MYSKPTPQSLLQQIAPIQSLDRGTVSVLRQGPQGPYYNHQCYENGRNVSRYVPSDQVPELKAAIDGYHRVQDLMAQYVQLLVEKTRADRAAGAKKKTPPLSSSWPRSWKPWCAPLFSNPPMRWWDGCSNKRPTGLTPLISPPPAGSAKDGSLCGGTVCLAPHPAAGRLASGHGHCGESRAPD
jgi:hypothetical protein